jgi:hypothetical protein
MKKVMFVVLSLLIVSAAFATESGPSNKVGYPKINCLGGVGTVSTPFGIAFQTWDVPIGNVPSYGVPSTCPSDIFGDQPACGTLVTADRILRQDNGQFAFRNSAAGCAWANQLETNCGAVPGRAYWYQNKTGADRALVVAGECNNTGNYANIAMTELAFTAYAWRDSRDLDRDDLNLLLAGFTGGALLTSDRVIDQVNGNFFWRNTTNNTWQGSAGFTFVSPSKAYWVQNKDHANDTWNYNYDASGASASIGGDVKQTKGGSNDIQLMVPKPVSKTVSAKN